MRRTHPANEAAAAVARLLIRWTRALVGWLLGRKTASDRHETAAVGITSGAAAALPRGGQDATPAIAATTTDVNGPAPTPAGAAALPSANGHGPAPVARCDTRRERPPFEPVPCVDAFPWPPAAA
ncbi:MAG: hypothetical protein ACYCUG_16040, partial [Acidimicrobiales bacterium]